MTHYIMETVGSEYLPTVGHNTIRKASAKYETLRPGDTVTMNFPHVNSGPVVEHLVVKAVVRADLATIALHHWEGNHGNFEGPDVCHDVLAAIYGSGDGEFLAVYFQ